MFTSKVDGGGQEFGFARGGGGGIGGGLPPSGIGGASPGMQQQQQQQPQPKNRWVKAFKSIKGKPEEPITAR